MIESGPKPVIDSANGFGELPPETKFQIFEHLDYESLERFGQTSHQNNALVAYYISSNKMPEIKFEFFIRTLTSFAKNDISINIDDNNFFVYFRYDTLGDKERVITEFQKVDKALLRQGFISSPLQKGASVAELLNTPSRGQMIDDKWMVQKALGWIYLKP